VFVATQFPWKPKFVPGGKDVQKLAWMVQRPPGKVMKAGAPCFWVVLPVLLGLAFASLVLDTYVTGTLLRRVAEVHTLDVAEAPPGTRTAILLPGALDARWYAMHAGKVLREGALRVRATDRDNAPDGREVHWSSLLVWVLAGLGSLFAAVSGQPVFHEVQRATLMVGPLTFLLGAGGFAMMAGRRYGIVWGGFAFAALATSFPFFDMFRVGEADHHGLAALAAMGSVLALAAGGAGWRRPGGGWYALSGVLGAAGMWLSASTVAPVLALAGGAIFLVPLGFRVVKRGGGIEAVGLWHWGVWGAGSSLVFYLLEYFPFHTGMRLEVNHPLYAAAWLGGAWILARWVSTMAAARGVPCPDSPGASLSRAVRAAYLALAGVAVAAPIVVVAVWKSSVFAPADPFLLALHSGYIREFAPAWKAGFSPGRAADTLWWPALALALAAAAVLHRRSLKPGTLAPVGLVVFVAMGIQIEAVMQIRWSGLAVGLWVVATLVAVDAVRGGAPPLPRMLRIGFAVWAAMGLLSLPVSSIRSLVALHSESGDQMPRLFASTLLLRDIAHRIVRDTPGERPVVLADPTTSTDLAFYGNLRVLGTLYWENRRGLARASAIFAGTDADAVKDLIADVGIRYIVLPSWDSFFDLTAHQRLLEAAGHPRPEKPPFLAGVIQGHARPDWLRPIPYPIPEAFGLEDARVAIYEFLPGQSPFDALRARGIYHFEMGEHGAALACLEEAHGMRPEDEEVAGWVTALRQKLEFDSGPD
jgi:hypothetical protein